MNLLTFMSRARRSPNSSNAGWIGKFWILGLALVLAGCKVSVDTRVTGAEANEELAVLLAAGIDAQKILGEGNLFDVEVPQSDLARALEVLKANGLPRQRFASLGELFKKEGLVATPAEERVRFIYGLSQELERTLSHIDGVVFARVHIVLPANDPLADVKKPSSASVFIKHRPIADPASLGPLVRSLVVRGVEGLDSEHVSVAFSVIDPPAPGTQLRWVNFMGIKVQSDSTFAFTMVAGLPWILLAICLAVLLTRYRGSSNNDLAAVRSKVDKLRRKSGSSSGSNGNGGGGNGHRE
jgi:type III secretion protein J